MRMVPVSPAATWPPPSRPAIPSPEPHHVHPCCPHRGIRSRLSCQWLQSAEEEYWERRGLEKKADETGMQSGCKT